MAVISNVMDYQQLINALQATGTWDSVAEAVQSGAVHQVTGGSTVIPWSEVQAHYYAGLQGLSGGKGMPVISYDDALTVAKNAQNLGAAAASVITGAGVLAKAAGAEAKYALVGACTLELPTAVAMAAPLAGVALGEGLYRENPSLWTKISQAMLPFCYAENKVQAYLDYYLDPTTGHWNPVMCLAQPLIDALSQLFEDEHVNTIDKSEVTDNQGRTVTGISPGALCTSNAFTYGRESYVEEINGDPMLYLDSTGQNFYIYGGDCTIFVKGDSSHSVPDSHWRFANGTAFGGSVNLGIGTNPYDIATIRQIIAGAVSYEPDPATPGVETPTLPEWFPSPEHPWIIVQPDPEEDPQEIPITPVTPLLPAPEPVPQLPEHVPDPTPEEPPEEWPEEEPWPTVVPFPVQPTEPTPDWPEVMPWPLPANPPSEWPLSPEVPEKWPEEFPSTEPWPRSPEQWPEEVPWPDHAPEDWPEGAPWPESPEEWPEEVPWPVPWPENWPETAPWPIKWPEELPYPWPFPYPLPSPNPYPGTVEDPTQQIDPYIDPWPFQWPDPYPAPSPNPDPYADPSQPDTKTEPKPQPTQPLDPYPTPPSGDLTPPIPPIIPLPFSATTGLITVYHPTQSELLSFAQWL